MDSKKIPKTRLKDIAKETGFSITTVSHVLSGQAKRYRISKSTQDKIFALAKEKQFKFNHLARALRKRETYTIGLVLPDITNPFFSSIAHSIELESRKLGYAIILCNSSEDVSVEIDSIELLMSREVSGLIILPVGKKFGHLQKLYNANIPSIIVDRYSPELKISYVGTDNHKGILDATSYLINCGHRQIACIQGTNDIFINTERVRGYKDALIANGLDIDESLIKGNSFDIENGYLSTKLLLNQPNTPTAILSFSNLITLGALKALEEENLKVPENISIIGFDEQSYSDYLSLTTIKQQGKEISQIAVKLLINQLTNTEIHPQKHILLPPLFIIRNSVKIIPQS